MKTSIKISVLFALVLSFAQIATAFPINNPNRWLLKATKSIDFTPGFNFDAIVALDNCSGALVKFKTTQDSEKALLLTNGHCYSEGIFGGMMSPGEVIVNKPSVIKPRLLTRDGATLRKLTTTRVIYGTMTSTDVTLYELNETYASIEQATGVKALVIADTVPAMGMNIQIPSGYWKRTYACQTDILVPELREAGYTFKQSIRFTEPGCDTIGGTSGSPLVSSSSGEVIGINNTGNENGEQCTMDNPCEVDDSGHITVNKGRSYGQQTYLFYGCLSAGADRIDLNQPTCLLPKP